MLMIFFCSKYFRNYFKFSRSCSFLSDPGLLLSSVGTSTVGDCLKFIYLLNLFSRIAFAFYAFYEPAELLACCKSVLTASFLPLAETR
jgi:hypothetical protein